MGAVPSSLTDTPTPTPTPTNPFDAFRKQQQAASNRPRTREQIATFASLFDPHVHNPTSIVIPADVTSTLGLAALTQDL